MYIFHKSRTYSPFRFHRWTEISDICEENLNKIDLKKLHGTTNCQALLEQLEILKVGNHSMPGLVQDVSPSLLGLEVFLKKMISDVGDQEDTGNTSVVWGVLRLLFEVIYL
jgi:hypothetical protein